jgi:aspartate dehydrogenase
MKDAIAYGKAKVGVAGLGAVGLEVARALDRGRIPGLQLSAVCSRSLTVSRHRTASFKVQPTAVSPSELGTLCDIVVECVPKDSFLEIAEPVLTAGATLVTVSGAALLANPGIVRMAEAHQARIVLVTGAVLGLDAIRAVAEGHVSSVRMITRKPPRAIAKAPYLTKRGIDVLRISEPERVFDGTALEGAEGFPSSANVAAAVGLAGIGAESTRLEIWADPTLARNTHTVVVEADSARFEMKIENVPSEENPSTGKISALSVIAALRAEVGVLKVGS